MNFRTVYNFDILCTGADKRILIWDVGSASQQCELRGHKDTVYQLVFSRDGALLASGGGDNTVKLWDVAAFVDDDKAMEPLRWCVILLELLYTCNSIKPYSGYFHW